MENTQLPVLDEDVFSSRDSTNRPSSSRIHFPPNESGSPRPMRTRPESQKGLSGLTPPIRRGSPLNPQNVNQGIDTRRRPWTSELPSVSPDTSSRQRRNHSLSHGNSTRNDSAPRDPNMNMNMDNELEMGVFSDEYDLSHEDPRILQDVQRALKMKARREARVNAETTTPDKLIPKSSPVSYRLETPVKKASPMPFATTSPSASPSPLPRTHNRKLSTSTSSDVDFSPAIGSFNFPIQEHPVPSSIDSGRTLDWTGSHSDENDKRWAISIGKRKEKDKLAPLAISIEEQEKSYQAKLSKINKLVSPQTLRKADITSAQLGRRYTLMTGSIESSKQSLDLAAISRWYATQPEGIRNSLEKAEPFTWLKHLEKRMGKTTRSHWNLSALIIEQYLRIATKGDHMQTIPEDATMRDSLNSFPRRSRSPSFLSSSQGAGQGVGSSLSMGLTVDGITFEPLRESKRASLDAVSRKSADSVVSSIRSGSSKAGMPPISPTSSHANDVNIRDPRNYNPQRLPSSSSLESSDSLSKAEELQLVSGSLVVPGFSIHPPSTERLVAEDPTLIPLTLKLSQESSSSSQKPALSHAGQSVTSLKASLNTHRVRISLPSYRTTIRQSQRYRETREEQLRREYEAKSTILRQSTAHNHKIRQLLNKIAASLAKYDALQTSEGNIPGVNQRRIPKDVLDTFTHDPSAVTRVTSKLRGWRAVEDIHQRVLRQRDTLRVFLNSVPQEPSNEGCILDEHIGQLLQALTDLELQKDEIFEAAEAVEILLGVVQDEHAKVKEKYNKTVSHVSIVYPELSTIVALEESYKDQYQQFWDLGLDALTLLLDTVTPFWRTYGKTIGEDVRDFLIIPLYRNEFTGQVKRYRIEEFPKRSLRHWLGLFVFFLTSIAVNILQFRAAITSLMNARLPMIPYDGVRWTALPFFWVGIIIQWLAVFFEFAIVILQLGVITWWTGWSVSMVS